MPDALRRRRAGRVLQWWQFGPVSGYVLPLRSHTCLIGCSTLYHGKVCLMFVACSCLDIGPVPSLGMESSWLYCSSSGRIGSGEKGVSPMSPSAPMHYQMVSRLPRVVGLLGHLYMGKVFTHVHHSFPMFTFVAQGIGMIIACLVSRRNGTPPIQSIPLRSIMEAPGPTRIYSTPLLVSCVCTQGL